MYASTEQSLQQEHTRTKYAISNVLLVLQLGLLVVSTLLHSVFPQITGTYLQRTYYSTAVFVS